jgi:hypothetical protein
VHAAQWMPAVLLCVTACALAAAVWFAVRHPAAKHAGLDPSLAGAKVQGGRGMGLTLA